MPATLNESTIGFGTMRITWGNDFPISQEEGVEILYTAYKAGARFFNGGEFYGEDFANLKLLQAFIDKYPEVKDEIIISIKGGFNIQTFQPDGSKEFIDQSVNNCYTHLKKIDVFECARVDKNVPLEDTLGYLQEHVKAGRIGGISLSEVSASTIRRAAKVAKIQFVENEASFLERAPFSNGVIDACAEFGIPLVAYSPLGSGLFGGITQFKEGDIRATYERLLGENIKKNAILKENLEAVAHKAGLSLPQLALSWLKFHNSDKNPDKAKYPLIIPIPGTVKKDKIIDNANIREISLETFKEVQDVLEKFPVAGGRYNSHMQNTLEG